MTTLSAKDLTQVFPLFDTVLANYIHEHGESKIFEAGEVLMRPGQYFKYAMLIVNGKVKLYREGEEGEGRGEETHASGLARLGARGKRATRGPPRAAAPW